MYEVESDTLPPGTIGELLKIGYMVKSKVLRPALVGSVKAKE